MLGTLLYHRWEGLSAELLKRLDMSHPLPRNETLISLRRSVNLITSILVIGFLLNQLIRGVFESYQSSFTMGLVSSGTVLILIAAGLYCCSSPADSPWGWRLSMTKTGLMFGLWALFVMTCLQAIEARYLPVKELLLGATLMGILWRYQQQKTLQSVAICCHGFVAGVLSYLVLFSGYQAV